MKIGVACHDAGGAEILASYCHRNKADYAFSMVGPAEKIFRRKFNNFENVELTALVNSVGELYTGTSGNSKFELEAIELAKYAGIKSKSFIDHWVNYEMRFTNEYGKLFLPDTLVAGDKYAKSKLEKTFPNHPIEFIENAYWEELRELVSASGKNKKSTDSSSCIFLSEGLAEFNSIGVTKATDGFDENGLIVGLLNIITKIDSRINRIIIRLHPTEDHSKYRNIESKFGPSIVISNEKKQLWEELLEYDLAIGFQSMALVIALQMGLRAVSVRPKGYPDIELPFREIERLEITI